MFEVFDLNEQTKIHGGIRALSLVMEFADVVVGAGGTLAGCEALLPAVQELGDDAEASRSGEVTGLYIDQRAVRPRERIVLRQMRAA